MATVSSELSVVLQTMVKPNYDNSLVDNYYDTTAMTPKVPSTGSTDRLLQLLTETILYSRSQARYGFNTVLTDTQRLEFYQDLETSLQVLIDVITGIQTPVTAKVAEITAILNP